MLRTHTLKELATGSAGGGAKGVNTQQKVAGNSFKAAARIKVTLSIDLGLLCGSGSGVVVGITQSKVLEWQHNSRSAAKGASYR
jgi:hypothetical protein